MGEFADYRTPVMLIRLVSLYMATRNVGLDCYPKIIGCEVVLELASCVRAGKKRAVGIAQFSGRASSRTRSAPVTRRGK